MSNEKFLARRGILLIQYREIVSLGEEVLGEALGMIKFFPRRVEYLLDRQILELMGTSPKFLPIPPFERVPIYRLKYTLRKSGNDDNELMQVETIKEEGTEHWEIKDNEIVYF